MGSRFGAGRPPGIGRRGLSVTTWLIIICFAFFAVDDLFMRGNYSWVPTGTYFVPGADGVWTQDQVNPLYGDKTASDQVTVGEKPVPAEVPLRRRDGTVEVTKVSGLPVSMDGKLEALAVATPMSPLQKWLHFSTEKVIGGAQLWRLLGFQFLHADFGHLLFNMIGLFFFGPLVERFLGGKRFLAFYLLCGIMGALLYLLLNLMGWVAIDQLKWYSVPGLLFNSTGVPLIGASAGVYGVVIGGAVLHPRATVLLFFLLPIRLATLAIGLIAISIIMVFIGTQNPGGEAAHLGGAIAGWYFIRNPQRLHDLFNFFGQVDPTSKHFAMKGPRPVRASGRRQDAQVDRILDKISREGLQSLSKKEKQILAEASRRDRGPS